MTVMTIVVAVLLLVRGHRRAAIFTAGVMIVDHADVHRRQGAGRPDPAGVAARAGPALLEVVPVRARRVRHRVRRHPDRARGDARAPQQHAPAARTSLIGLMVVVVCLDRVLLGRHYPSDVVGGVLLGHGDGAARAGGLQPAAAQPRRSCCRAAARRRSPPTATSPSCSTRSRSRTSSAFRAHRELDGRRGRLVARRSGTTRPSRTPAPAWPRRPRSPAPTWCWSAAATAPCARSAPSWPAPASRSGSSRPAPATCWPATSTSRCSCAPRSTSRSPARTAPSTWSR